MSLELTREKALKYSKLAVEADNDQNIELSLKYYKKALILYTSLLADDDPKREFYLSRFRKYLDRAESISLLLTSSQQVTESDSEELPRTPSFSSKKPNQKSYDFLIKTEKPSFHWDEVKGLDNIKNILGETIHIRKTFQSLEIKTTMPWQTLLLFGPAGSGKRFLAQAFCSELSSTFISLETSLIPKDLKNEKILKNLFEIAIKNRPAVVFIDEIHLLINEENENSRILPEFLDQLEKSGNFQDLVVFCSTTKPWRLDPDVCRRVERKIYVPLPDWERRKEVIREGLGRKCPDFVVEQLADLTSGFSAEDLRKLGRVLQEKERISEEFKEECKDNGKTSDVKIFREGQVEESGGKHQDFYQAVSMVKPSVSLNTLIRYQYFAESYFETFNINPC